MYMLGMALRRVVRCAQGGCLLWDVSAVPRMRYKWETALGFFDNTTPEEAYSQTKTNRVDLEPHEMVLSMESAPVRI